MNRRELLKMIAAATGTAFVGGPVLAYEMRPPVSLTSTGFTEQDVMLLDEIGETIVPKTDTPGAKDAGVGRMMAVFVADCYTEAERTAFKEGMVELQKGSMATYQKDFLLLSPAQKLEYLNSLDTEARQYNAQNGIYRGATTRPDSRSESTPLPVPHYFSLFKQLTLYSFFTSEVGATKVLRYVAIPGRYDGDMPYQKGDRSWAT